MALSITQTHALFKVLKLNSLGRVQTECRIASMGYPDIIFPSDALETLMDMGAVTYRNDSEAICKRHGLKQRPIPDAHSLFSALGCKLDVFDIVQERGDEILCDLNEPMATSNAYDIVLDVGTLEHCFNVAQAMFNMASLVKQGGYILHENPFNCGNHGFYNLNPTFYVDFYKANGFEVIECKLVDRTGAECSVPHTDRFRFFQQEVNTFAMAKRIKIQEFVFPTQSKYVNFYAAAGLTGEKAEVVNG